MAVVKFEYSSRKGQMFEGHHHHEIEIYYLASGQRYYYINGKTHLVMPRDLVIVREDLAHRVFSAGIGQYERYLLYTNREFIAECLKENERDNFYRAIDSDAFVYRLHDPSKVELLFRKMLSLDLIKPLSIEQKKELERYSAQIISDISTSLSETGSQTADVGYVNKNMLLITEYINANYKSNITLDILASKFSLSKYYLCKLFKKSVGFTFSDFLNQVRVTEAKKLLETTELSVADVAYETGYSDIAYFCRVFKKLMGITALKYRKESDR